MISAERVILLQRRPRDPVHEVDHLPRKILGRPFVGIERERGDAVGARRAAHAQVDATGRDAFEHAELLGDLERRIVRQHHAGAADANAGRGRGDRRHQHFRCGADDAAAVVMFGHPVAVVAERVAQARQRERFANGLAFGAALGGGGLIEDREFHCAADIPRCDNASMPASIPWPCCDDAQRMAFELRLE